MAGVKQALRSILGKLMFDELLVTVVREHGPNFRSLELAGETLRGATCRAGDKIQLMLSDGPRTYTPFAFDAEAGTLQLLAYLHGDSSGSTWARELTVGTSVMAFGPRASLPLTELDGPVVLFGDETSLAVAIALAQHRGARTQVQGIFEVASKAETESALADFDFVPHTLVERGDGTAHFGRVDQALRAVLRPEANLVLTGRAQSIQAVRAALKAHPVAARHSRVKPYWSVGKRGLD